MSYIFNEPPEASQPRRFAPLAAVVAGAGLAFSAADRAPASEHYEEPAQIFQARRFAPLTPPAKIAGFSAGRRLPDASQFEDAPDLSQRRRFAPLSITPAAASTFSAARRQPDAASFEDGPDLAQRRRFAPIVVAVVQPYAGFNRGARLIVSLQGAGAFDEVQADPHRAFAPSIAGAGPTLKPFPTIKVAADPRGAAVAAGGRGPVVGPDARGAAPALGGRTISLRASSRTGSPTK